MPYHSCALEWGPPGGSLISSWCAAMASSPRSLSLPWVLNLECTPLDLLTGAGLWVLQPCHGCLADGYRAWGARKIMPGATTSAVGSVMQGTRYAGVRPGARCAWVPVSHRGDNARRSPILCCWMGDVQA